MKHTTTPSALPPPGLVVTLRILAIVALLFFFLVGVKGLGTGFKMLGKDMLDAFFLATANPFVALMVGILGTTLVQSSSVTTAMVVGLVAAPDNPLPIENAIPMIMGANIGTTVTNTVVSLAHMGRREEFRRAFAVATCHDFFNFMTVIVLLPLELTTHYLRRTAEWMATHFSGLTGVTYDSPISGALKTSLVPLKSLAKATFETERTQGLLIIAVSGALIFGALFLLVKVLRSTVQSRVESVINRVLGRNVILSLIVGAVVTVMVQSSSITTSLLVPLAGAGILTLPQAFPVTLGANLGTTITAFLASLATSGGNAQAGIVIALVHLLFNSTGTLMILPVRSIRNLPIRAASWFAEIAVESRRWAVVYVVVLFYGLPALFAFLFR
jgi:sodium-dependent phosphate cotransporter